MAALAGDTAAAAHRRWLPPGSTARELATAIAWGVLAYALTSVRIELPGPVAFHTDLTEVALLGGAIFLARPWLTLVACAIEALNVVPPATLALSFETTFLMHAVAVPCAWYAHRALQRRQPGNLTLGLSWFAVVVAYYLVLLIPMLIATSVFIPPSLEPPLGPGGIVQSYWRVARAVPYEVLLTASLTALTFVTKEELRRRRRVETELREALASQRALVLSAPVAVVSVRADGVVSGWNPAAERMFGTSEARAIGGPAPGLRRRGGKDGPGGDSLLASLLAGTPLLGVDGEVDGGGAGDVIPVSVFGAPLCDTAGVPDGAVLLVEDLREQVALRAQLHRGATMSALGQLVGGLAHELRNPLFGITAALDAFGPHLAGHPRLEQLERTLRGQVGQMKALMVGLLDYGKAAGGEERSVASLDLPLRHALADCAEQAAAAGSTIDVAVPAGLPLVSMDALRLVQVFRNLLQNALAFSPAGAAVRLEGACEQDGERALVRVEVLDRGPGFRAEDLARIFEPFFSRRAGGTGLGLAIVRRIVEQHGGTVEAANRPGGGARVVVRLPAA
ncbi:MAG TPA: ATP-binding protein [Kofleriaceae bacterium]|nr:ATP-binding protein [Kofleriaceae bacterium]